MKKYKILLLISVLFVSNIYAQRWEYYTPENTGLQSDNVLSMASDKYGNIWIGTRFGLTKYDGNIWVNYNKLNSDLPTDRIYSIAIDNYGNKWLGTDKGLVKFDEVESVVFNKNNSGLTSDTIVTIAIDNENNKWLGTLAKWNIWDGYYAGGLVKFDGTNWTNYNDTNSELPSGNIYTIAIDNSNTKWVGTNCGIAKIDGSDWTVFNTENSNIPSDTIISIAIDEFDNKWIGFSYNPFEFGLYYAGAGLAKFDNEKWHFYNENNSELPSNNISSIVVDEFNNKWIGTTMGVAKYNDETWEIYNPSNSNMPSNIIKSLSIDSNGNKWIGLVDEGYEWDGKGIGKFDGTDWNFYSHSNTGLKNKWINSLVIDEQGNKWLGNWDGGGLTKFDGKVWTNYNRSNSNIPADTIPDLALDNSGNLWLATYKGGLSKFDGKTWTNYNTSNSKLPSNIVYCITIDKLGNKWVGTKDGLAMFDDDNWTIYNITWVSSICIDDEGNKWIGTSGNGLYKYDGQDWVNYTVFNSELVNNWISDIAIDNDGNAWIINCSTIGGETGDGALIKINEDTWTVYDTYNSDFQNNHFQSIFIDEFNTIWVGRNIELSRLYCDNITHYSPPTNVSELKYVASIAKDKSGDLWLGTVGGLVRFYNYPEIVDNTPPTMSCHDDLVVEANNVNGYIVAGIELDIIDAADNCAVESLINDFNDNSTLEGDTLPEGTNSITWTLTDKAGNTNLCSFTVIVNPYVGIESIHDYGISIYPNPVNEVVNFNFGTNNITCLTIIDIVGNNVLELRHVKQYEKVNISNLSDGIYFVIIQLNNKKLVHKIIKQK